MVKKKQPAKILLLMVIAFVLGGISNHVVFAAPPSPGHGWSQIECDSNLCVDTASGRVGVGTTTPVYNFDVSASAIRLGIDKNGGGRLVITNNPNDNKIFLEAISFNGLTSASEMLLTGYASGNVPKLSLLADVVYVAGNLGVGVTNPTAKLDVNGDVKVSGKLTECALPTYVGESSIGYNGDLNGGPGGYANADNKCSISSGLAGSHVCTHEEVGRSLRCGITLPPTGTNHWIDTYAASYYNPDLGAEGRVSDCDGWLFASNTVFGNSWDGNSLVLAACNQAIKFLCCK